MQMRSAKHIQTYTVEFFGCIQRDGFTQRLLDAADEIRIVLLFDGDRILR